MVDGAKLRTASGASIRLTKSKVSVLETSSERALVELQVPPVLLVGTVAIDDLERAFIVEPTPLQPDVGEPWITLEPGAEVIPVTKHALEGDEAPVILEGNIGCKRFIWRGAVPTSAIGRVVERHERTSATDAEPGVLSRTAELKDGSGATRIQFASDVFFDPIRAAAVEFTDDGSAKVSIPFERFTVSGWVSPGQFLPEPIRDSPNPTCEEATAVKELPEPTARNVMLSLPEHTCLLAEDGSVSGVLSPPHLFMIGTDSTEQPPPEPTEVGAELVADGWWRVWVPTKIGELSFLVAESESSAGTYRRCAPSEGEPIPF